MSGAARLGEPASAQRRRMARRGVTAAAAVALATGAFWFYHARKAQAAALPMAAVHRGEFEVIVHTEGSLQARRSVQLTAPRDVPALQIVWLAPPGSRVKPGDPVIRFDSSTIEQQLEGKLADLKQAQATLDQAEAQARITAEQDRRDLAAAKEAVESARLDASQAAILSVIDGEEKKIALGMAREKLRVEAATVNLHKASSAAKIASLAQERDQAQYQVNLARARLRQLTVKAPLNGVVSYLLNRSQGWMNAQPFKVGDQVWPGATIAEIPDLATLQMNGRLQEADRGRIAVGDRVHIHVDALPEKNFSGQLAFISAMPQLMMGGTWPPIRSFRAYGAIDHADPRLRPAMNGSMDIVIQRLPDSLSIPARALFTAHASAVVYVHEGSGWHEVGVKVLARNPDQIAIAPVRTGALKAGMMVSLEDPTQATAVGQARAKARNTAAARGSAAPGGAQARGGAR